MADQIADATSVLTAEGVDVISTDVNPVTNLVDVGVSDVTEAIVNALTGLFGPVVHAVADSPVEELAGDYADAPLRRTAAATHFMGGLAITSPVYDCTSGINVTYTIVPPAEAGHVNLDPTENLSGFITAGHCDPRTPKKDELGSAVQWSHAGVDIGHGIKSSYYGGSNADSMLVGGGGPSQTNLIWFNPGNAFRVSGAHYHTTTDGVRDLVCFSPAGLESENHPVCQRILKVDDPYRFDHLPKGDDQIDHLRTINTTRCGEGDSGAPVFKRNKENPAYVTVVGVLVGKAGRSHRCVFSSTAWIKHDLDGSLPGTLGTVQITDLHYNAQPIP